MSSHTSAHTKTTQIVKNKLATNGTVDVSIECHFDGSYPGGMEEWSYVSWKMQLERLEGATWKVIGTREGYATVYSHSHRTFTNVGNHGAMRVRTFCDKGMYGGKFLLIDTVRNSG